MTCRMILFGGLLAALSAAAFPATYAAENSAPSNLGSVAPAGDSVSTWKSTGRVSSVDIRFRKPDGIIFSDLPAESASASSEANPAGGATITDTDSPAAPASANRSATKTTAIPTRETAGPQTNELKSPASLASPASESTAAASSATTTIDSKPASQNSASTLHADGQIELVARLLKDQGVVLAAQEETLPATPDAVAPRTTNGHPAGDGCLDGGECCPDACCPQPRLFWVGGVEATFLVPDLNSDGVNLQVDEFEYDRFDNVTTHDVDVDDMYVSPRIWLGVQGCCWGANLRYWHLQASEGAYDPSVGGLGTWDDYDCGRPDLGYFSCNRLEAYTVDLEITRRFCIHDCWMQASVGVRHAEIENHENITGLALTDAGLLNGFARADRYSRGTGFLLGLYGRKPIFPCSCVHWFYNARWSAMWGPTQTSAETFAAALATDDDFVASAASVNGAYTTIDDTLFVGEIQLGLEWDYALCCLPANAFFRIAVEYQRWDGGKGFSGADSFAGIEIDDGSSVAASLIGTAASAGEPQMDLLGFTIGTGLTW